METLLWKPFWFLVSASPKPRPTKPRPCSMPQAKTEVALQFSECCAAETALQHWLFCSADVILTRSCAAASEKLHCNIEKAALQESGAFLPLSCEFQAPTFRHPRFGLADGPCRNFLRRLVGPRNIVCTIFSTIVPPPHHLNKEADLHVAEPACKPHP